MNENLVIYSAPAKKINHNQFHSRNYMALTTGLFVFGKIGAQEQHVLRYGIAYTTSQLSV